MKMLSEQLDEGETIPGDAHVARFLIHKKPVLAVSHAWKINR
jgi:hypothetical protein